MISRICVSPTIGISKLFAATIATSVGLSLDLLTCFECKITWEPVSTSAHKYPSCFFLSQHGSRSLSAFLLILSCFATLLPTWCRRVAPWGVVLSAFVRSSIRGCPSEHARKEKFSYLRVPFTSLVLSFLIRQMMSCCTIRIFGLIFLQVSSIFISVCLSFSAVIIPWGSFVAFIVSSTSPTLTKPIVFSHVSRFTAIIADWTKIAYISLVSASSEI